ncbi:MAG: VOC family protein, partial [Candidatus Binatia bacterium]
QVANFRQLKDAVRFLEERGSKVRDDIPTEFHPGIDYAAHVLDPDGHCIQLYCAMEQIGWDGRPRSREFRAPLKVRDWPESLGGNDNVYLGEPFLGPWG